MELIEAHRRPHYPPTARLAILELRAARCWTLAQAARIFLVSPLTITSWMGRLDEEGPEALVRLPEPANRFPDFVSYLVRRLKVPCPSLGKVKTAQILTRAGLHLGSTTIRRMQQDTRGPEPRKVPQPASRVVSAKKPNHLWHADLTTVPTALGFWVSWLPFTLPQVWPFCWWLEVTVDHFSRRVMEFAVYRALPSSVSSPVHAGPVDLPARHLKCSSVVSPERWCNCRLDSPQDAGISQSSRSSALRRGFRLARLTAESSYHCARVGCGVPQTPARGFLPAHPARVPSESTLLAINF